MHSITEYFGRVHELCSLDTTLWYSNTSGLSITSGEGPEIRLSVNGAGWILSASLLDSGMEDLNEGLIFHLSAQIPKWYRSEAIALGVDSKSGAVSLSRLDHLPSVSPEVFLKRQRQLQLASKTWADWFEHQVQTPPRRLAGPPRPPAVETAAGLKGKELDEVLVQFLELLPSTWKDVSCALPIEGSLGLAIPDSFGITVRVRSEMEVSILTEAPLSEGNPDSTVHAATLRSNFLKTQPGKTTSWVSGDRIHYERRLPRVMDSIELRDIISELIEVSKLSVTGTESIRADNKAEHFIAV